jgi:hypothetical protein
MIIPRTIHLASAVLPAAGAFTGQTAFDVPEGTKELLLYCTYTRGAAGGFPRFQPMYGNGTEEVQSMVIDSSSFTAAAVPQGRYNVFQEQINGPIPAAGTPILYCLRVCMEGGNTTFRLLAAEAGVVGTPGTLAITLTGSG